MIIKLNEYIEKFSDIKPLLDQELERTLERDVCIQNNGCSNKVIIQVVKYLQAHDCTVIVESQGAAND